MKHPPNEPEFPLTEATFTILLSLTPRPKHGYAIMKDVEELSAGRVVLTTGTLYGALKRLLEQGWIMRVAQDDEVETGRPRKTYGLTDLGCRMLDAEIGRMKALVAVAGLRTAQEGAL